MLFLIRYMLWNVCVFYVYCLSPNRHRGLEVRVVLSLQKQQHWLISLTTAWFSDSDKFLPPLLNRLGPTVVLHELLSTAGVRSSEGHTTRGQGSKCIPPAGSRLEEVIWPLGHSRLFPDWWGVLAVQGGGPFVNILDLRNGPFRMWMMCENWSL